FNVSVADTLKTWTVMESIVSLVGLARVLVLARLNLAHPRAGARGLYENRHKSPRREPGDCFDAGPNRGDDSTRPHKSPRREPGDRASVGAPSRRSRSGVVWEAA
ncbi:MAG: hypothetical protein ACKOHK_00415, partial [Planctomycetia bacterium]